MEDVLEVYTLPYNEKRPVVCLDETSRQLIGEVAVPLPVQRGQPAVYDYEYVRNGVVDFFMLFEPLAGRREVTITQTRTAVDFAYCLKDLADHHYPNADKILLVMDNLNTHALASLYTAFPPEQARRLAERFEVHHTPKHASWLNMAEIEIGVMSRQCLNRRIPIRAQLTNEVQSWLSERNARQNTVRWHFSTADARIKLQHLYPKI
jgi:hypothetical protein